MAGGNGATVTARYLGNGVRYLGNGGLEVLFNVTERLCFIEPDAALLRIIAVLAFACALVIPHLDVTW